MLLNTLQPLPQGVTLFKLLHHYIEKILKLQYSMLMKLKPGTYLTKMNQYETAASVGLMASGSDSSSVVSTISSEFSASLRCCSAYCSKTCCHTA